ncbi:4-hydroxy-tetrahydrodipicolinate synthase [Paraburkholderia saeva]|uniref:4-hydroxy-tetrahydrodipicolinate synthase n=1 Tax=Paraburkholderia saeva TaxID=2777537 RepID=A0A9N8S2G2_9BURK|nr:4-hydroxy-tetrahydrodipicolinate synthase [Paraburkholderia saeva]CAG4921865.1 4-hydroxy-tetrahydrodipicolinate synthase [Paraburkholderia saeva]CAG4925733.1 4-hydroxy-tetrahydrodipicolinate synthase [Paraburkholderia saeva]CAG4927498.1 4-hydroxy-tetrahydrodipicolinate synthase [Paraburkholderia saeva]
MSIFSGIWIPLITPFADGAVDHAALRALVGGYVTADVAGFVALGTTGEPAALDETEQAAVLATILAAAGDVPVIAGVSGNHAATLRERVVQLNDAPVAGMLISAPYYIRPSQAGLIDHFASLADISRKPVVIYDIPARTGVQIELETLLTLAAHPRIEAVKDCAGSLDTTLALILDGRLRVLAGDDANLFATLCMGGAGAIAASAHVRTARFVALYRALAAGRLDEGRAIWHSLVPLVRAMFDEPNPGPVKSALAAQGVIRDGLRAPMTRASDALQQRLRELVAA